MMVERNISGLIIHGDSMKSNRMQANVRYVTNFVDEVVSYVFFPLEGEPTQWMDIRPHLPNAKAVEVIKDIRSRRSALSHVGDQASELVERIKQARLENTKLGIVGYQLMHELPYDIMEALKRGLPNATFENVTEVYDEIQMYHSTEEVEFMKKAARLTDIAAEGMVKSDCGKLSGFLL
jgi:Xaa-Pro aminopeptidase